MALHRTTALVLVMGVVLVLVQPLHAAQQPKPKRGCTGSGSSCASNSECCSESCNAVGNCDCSPNQFNCNADADCCNAICNFFGSCCQDLGTTCSGDTDCCSGKCNTNDVCCTVDGESCTAGTDCCGGNCCAGTCSSSACCIPVGGNSCSSDSSCCSGKCQSFQCCLDDSSSCSSDAECCGGTCCQGTGTCSSTGCGPSCSDSVTFTAPPNGTTSTPGTPVRFEVTVTAAGCTVTDGDSVTFTFAQNVQVRDWSVSGKRVSANGAGASVPGTQRKAGAKALSQVAQVINAAGNSGQAWVDVVATGTLAAGSVSATYASATSASAAVVTWAPNPVATLLLAPSSAHCHVHDSVRVVATALDASNAPVAGATVVIAAHGDCAPSLARQTITTDAAGRAVVTIFASKPGAVAVVAVAFNPSSTKTVSNVGHIFFTSGYDDDEEREYAHRYYGTGRAEALRDSAAAGSDADKFAAAATQLALAEETQADDVVM